MFSKLIRGFRGFRSLLTLLTILPLGNGSLSEAARVFYTVPLVGLIEGSVLASILIISKILGLDCLLAGTLYTATHVVVTGGLHLDGFADYSDVIGSRARGVSALNILKDPRKGSFAIVMVVINLSITTASAKAVCEMIEKRVAGLITLASLIVLNYVLAAESLYLVVLYGDEEPYDGMARFFSREAKSKGLTRNLAILSVLMLGVLIAASITLNLGRAFFISALMLLITLAVVLYVVRDSRSRVGFVNGDIAGFTYELTRIMTLLTMAIIMRVI